MFDKRTFFKKFTKLEPGKDSCYGYSSVIKRREGGIVKRLVGKIQREINYTSNVFFCGVLAGALLWIPLGIWLSTLSVG